jgi:hypothetical protein
MEGIASVSSAAAAKNAGPMPEEAMADYNYRMAWVGAMAQLPAGQTPDAKPLVDTVRDWAEVKWQMIVADMAQRWRVDAVTQRYQQHMEKVRIVILLPSLRSSYVFCHVQQPVAWCHSALICCSCQLPRFTRGDDAQLGLTSTMPNLALHPLEVAS